MEDRHPDLDYALGEIINIQSELEQYFGNPPADALNVLQRLERLETELAALTDATLEFVREAADSPFWARSEAAPKLVSILSNLS
jgi:hypothetical protein